MRLTYDTDVDALTIVLSRDSVAQTVDVGQGRFLDLDEDGNIVALEILDALEGFDLRDLVGRYDLAPVFAAIASYARNARTLLREDEFLRDLVA